MKKLLAVVFPVAFTFFLTTSVSADILTIPHAAFTSGNSVIHKSGSYLYCDTPTAVQAPFQLPDEAIIDGIRLFYSDNGPGYLNAGLVRQNVWNGTTLALFSLQTSGEIDQRRWLADYSLNTGWRVVNNPNNGYWIDVYFNAGGNDYRLFAVQVIYHLPTT